MQRDFTQRLALWAHDKESFIYPFTYINLSEGYGYNLTEIVKPLLTQTQEEALVLAGNYPKNITEWIWSAPGEHDEDQWLLLCRLSTGAYAFYRAGCDYTGFDCQGSMFLTVSNSLAEIIEHGMGSHNYDLYLKKTTTDLALVSPDIDKEPHGHKQQRHYYEAVNDADAAADDDAAADEENDADGY